MAVQKETGKINYRLVYDGCTGAEAPDKPSPREKVARRSRVGSGMRAGMLDVVRRNRLSKTKSFSKSVPVPHRRLSPEFHSRPQFANWGHPLPGRGVMLRI